MAAAMLWPEPEKLRRKGSSPLEIKGQNAGTISHARTVLSVLPEMAEQVRDGIVSLNEAVGIAEAVRESV